MYKAQNKTLIFSDIFVHVKSFPCAPFMLQRCFFLLWDSMGQEMDGGHQVDGGGFGDGRGPFNPRLIHCVR